MPVPTWMSLLTLSLLLACRTDKEEDDGIWCDRLLAEACGCEANDSSSDLCQDADIVVENGDDEACQTYYFTSLPEECQLGSGDSNSDGGSDGGSGGGACWFNAYSCVEPNESDNRDWCEGYGGSYTVDGCPSGADGYCQLSGGGAYSADAVMYYYDGVDGRTACAEAGGEYTENSEPTIDLHTDTDF